MRLFSHITFGDSKCIIYQKVILLGCFPLCCVFKKPKKKNETKKT